MCLEREIGRGAIGPGVRSAGVFWVAERSSASVTSKLSAGVHCREERTKERLWRSTKAASKKVTWPSLVVGREGHMVGEGVTYGARERSWLRWLTISWRESEVRPEGDSSD